MCATANHTVNISNDCLRNCILNGDLMSCSCSRGSNAIEHLSCKSRISVAFSPNRNSLWSTSVRLASNFGDGGCSAPVWSTSPVAHTTTKPRAMKNVARNCKNYNALYAAYSYYDNHCMTIVKHPPSTSIRQLKTNSHSLNRAKWFNFQTLLIYLSFANNFNAFSAHSSAKFRKCFLLSVITIT